jgi:RimJ/RimL family protein N-acetyltransferase
MAVRYNRAAIQMTPGPFAFRPLVANDIPVLYAWLHRPHVAEWWGDPGSLRDVERDYLPYTVAALTTRAYIAVLNNEPIGLIQSYVVKDPGNGWWENETDPGARGIDQFLANPEQLGQGLGSAMVSAFTARLFADPAVTTIQTDPSPANQRAIRCYCRARFVAQGEVVTPDGPALLMVRSR